MVIKKQQHMGQEDWNVFEMLDLGICYNQCRYEIWTLLKKIKFMVLQ